MKIKPKEWIIALGGKPSAHLLKLCRNSYCFYKDNILKAKLIIAFSAKLPVDYIHQIVESHKFQPVDVIKDELKYLRLGKILSEHFSPIKIKQLINSLDEHSYHFYLDTLQEFYDYCRFFLSPEDLNKRLHRHLKSIKQLASVLHELLNSAMSPDAELEIQRQFFFELNNRFIPGQLQIYIPVMYNELKRISNIFTNCLGSPMIKKQLDDRDFAIVVLKRDNKFIAVMDVRKDLNLKDIKAHFNVNLSAEENQAIRDYWVNNIIPLLIKKNIVF